MAARVRGHAWAATPLGACEGWPPALRAAVQIALDSPIVATVLWGPELRMVYNDAYAAILAERHPGALGRPIAEVFSEIGDALRAQTRAAVEGGRGFSTQAERLVLIRDGRPTETWWTYTFAPIRDENGAIAGLFNTAFEVTELVLAQRRQALLIAVADALRERDDPDAMAGAVAALVGRHLGADRCGYGEVSEGGATFTVARDWAREGVPPFRGAHRIDDFGPKAGAELAAGRVVRVGDARTDPRLPEGARRAFEAIDGVRAALCAPFVKEGRPRAALYVHRLTPWSWSEEEGRLLLEVAERTAAAVERARSMAALAAREAELREALGVRDLLIQEVNHRVKNSLQLVTSVLNLEAGRSAGPEARARLAAAAGRVRAIAAVHASLYRSGDVRRVEAAEQLRELCAQLAEQAGADERGVAIELRAEPLHVPTETAVTLSLLVNELVTNALKHAFGEGEGGTVAVTLARLPDGAVELAVADDGRGGARGGADEASSASGLGSRLVEAFARQLGGAPEVSRGAQGWRTRLRFRLDG